MTTEASTYQGWKNYPTWCINLWISNDEPLYREWLNMVHRAGADSASDLGQSLKDWVQEFPGIGDEDAVVGFPADLLGYALDQVDWMEIATTWIKDES